MKGFGQHHKSKRKIKNKTRPNKEQIINQAIQLHLNGNIPEATRIYQQLINHGCSDHRVFSNYGSILYNSDKLKEAEIFTRKAIKISPTFAEAHLNLGSIMRKSGKLKEAEIFTRNAMEIKPDYIEGYLNLRSILIDLGKLKEARICSEKIMCLRPWSIIGSYSLNFEIQLD